MVRGQRSGSHDNITVLETIFLGVQRPDLRWTFRFFPSYPHGEGSHTWMKGVGRLEGIAPMGSPCSRGTDYAVVWSCCATRDKS